MKRSLALLSFILIAILHANAQSGNTVINELDKMEPKVDSAGSTFTSVEVAPDFPGGIQRFYAFVLQSIRLPELVSIFGLKDRVVTSFTIDASSSIINIKSLSYAGLGMDEEIAGIISHSPHWAPGRQTGRPVSVSFTAPFSFNMAKDTITIAELKKASYDFIFQINNSFYTVDKAEAVLGKSFPHARIDELTFYTDAPPFKVKDKNRLYLIKLKS